MTGRETHLFSHEIAGSNVDEAVCGHVIAMGVGDDWQMVREFSVVSCPKCRAWIRETAIERKDIMARTVNRVILVGNAGGDPDVRERASGRAVAHLSLATSRVMDHGPHKGEDRADWHRLTFFDEHAETVGRRVRKGARLYVEGSLFYGTFERGGVMIPTVDVVVDDLVILDEYAEPEEEADRDLLVGSVPVGEVRAKDSLAASDHLPREETP